jgi:hypothetical protein
MPKIVEEINWVPFEPSESFKAWMDWLKEERKTMYSRYGIPERYFNHGFQQNRNSPDED